MAMPIPVVHVVLAAAAATWWEEGEFSSTTQKGIYVARYMLSRYPRVCRIFHRRSFYSSFGRWFQLFRRKRKVIWIEFRTNLTMKHLSIRSRNSYLQIDRGLLYRLLYEYLVSNEFLFLFHVSRGNITNRNVRRRVVKSKWVNAACQWKTKFSLTIIFNGILCFTR